MPFVQQVVDSAPDFGVTEADFNEVKANQNYLNGRLEIPIGPRAWRPVDAAQQPILADSGLNYDSEILRFPNSGNPQALARVMVPLNYAYAIEDNLDLVLEYYSSGQGSFAWELDVAITREGENMQNPPKLAAPVRQIEAVTQTTPVPDGKMFTIRSNRLYEVNPLNADVTAASSTIGYSEGSGIASAAYTDGYIYAFFESQGRFVRIDPSTGQGTEIRTSTGTLGPSMGAFTHSNGTMYLVVGQRGQLYEVHPPTGTLTAVGNASATWAGVTAMTEHEGTVYLFREGGDLDTIDITTGAITDGLRISGDRTGASSGAGAASFGGTLYLSIDGRYLVRVPDPSTAVVVDVGDLFGSTNNRSTLTVLEIDDPTVGTRKLATVRVPQAALSAALASLTPARLSGADGLALILGVSLANLGGAAAINRPVRLSNAWLRLGGHTAVSLPGRARALMAVRHNATTIRASWEAPVRDDGTPDATVVRYEYNLGADWVNVGNVLTTDISVTAGTYNVYVRAVNPSGHTFVPSFASVTV